MTNKERFVLNNYEITKDGKVFSDLNCNNNYQRRELSLREDKDGYYDVTLVYDNNGNRQPFRVHRLVALKYIPNPKNLDIVNHIDLDKKNNHMSNLRWSTISKNTQHGYDNCTYDHIKKVKSIEPDGTIHVFPSASHASRYYNYANPSCVQHILEGRSNNPVSRGKREGLYFEYTEESVTTIERKASTDTSV